MKMNINNLEFAELNIYNDLDENISIPLSKKQVLMMLKVIGFEFNENDNYDNYTCFDDNTLDKILNMKSNPLHLKKIN